MFFVKLKRELSRFPKIFNYISKIKLHVIGVYYSFFMTIFSIFPINNKKIMFINYSGKGYSDNGKYIAKELLKKQKFTIFWAVKSNYIKCLPENITPVKINSIRFLYHLSTSKIWINNSRFVYGIKKRKNQFYIQTWHSSLRLKKIEKDAENILNPQYIKTCIEDSKMIDIITSGCEFSTNIYKHSFWYDGEVLNCGTPRCDLFFDQEQTLKLKTEICKKYNIDATKKIILYAPTFRKNSDEDKVYINFNKILKHLGKDYNLLVRFHPISKYKIKNTNIIDVTEYPDMQELIAISDFLVTDYSGCCFDAMIKKIPCVLFTKDLDEYLKKERNLYFNFEELPFPSVNTEYELYKKIINFDYNGYYNEIKKFNKKVGLYEKGNASKIISEMIVARCLNEKI